ncbi:MAG: hypothetical protein R3C14_39480 [Caldilineaceae bacterium]
MRISNQQNNILSHREIACLVTEREGPCLSFFLPIFPHGAHEPSTEPLRLQALVEQAASRLAELGLRAAAIEALLAPVLELARPNQKFWMQQRNGLAVYVAANFFAHYRLPLSVPEQVVVNQRFAITPLLPSLDGDGVFYLLALSQKMIRFFRGSRDKLTAIELPNAPTSLAEATRYDQVERTLQLHSTGSPSGQGRRPVVFHGQGVSGDETLDHIRLRHFFQAVDHAVTAHLAMEQAPLLLAGVVMDQGLYRQINHYPHLLAQGIPGNPNKRDEADLHKAAWAVVADRFQEKKRHALARYAQLAGQEAGRTLCDVETVALAAIYQKVDTLLVATEGPCWGRFIPENFQMFVHKEALPGDEDLINLAVIHTLINHGTVYTVAATQLPEDAALAAILRPT